MLTKQELQSLRNLGNEAEAAADEIERLRAELEARPQVWRLPWAPVEVARRFHDAYEAFAPSFGYTTREDTRQFDPNSPNGQLMVAVIRQVLIEQTSHEHDRIVAERDALRALLAASVAVLRQWAPNEVELIQRIDAALRGKP